MIFPLVPIDPVLWPFGARATLIPATDLPEPYKSLLAHTYHMTVTVEAHYGQPVDVRVMESGRDGDFYHRRIVLELAGSKKVVQYGGVRLNLTCCSAPVRAAILEEKTPLGRVLIEHNVLRRVEPTGFLRVEPGPQMMAELGMTEAERLYGRTGVIFFDDRPAIGVVEVLAPT
jgi:chorismate-pyruvate lyase